MCICGAELKTSEEERKHKAHCDVFQRTELKKAADETRAAKNVIETETRKEDEEEKRTLKRIKNRYKVVPRKKEGIDVCEECGDTETVIFYIPATKHPASCLDCLEKALSKRNVNVF